MKLSHRTQYIVLNVVVVAFFAFLAIFAHILLSNKHTIQIDQQLRTSLADFSLETLEKIQNSTDKLRALSSAVAFSKDLNFTKFENYIRSYDSNEKSWWIIEWQPIVSGNERESFEKMVKTRISPDFFMWQPDENGIPVRASNKAEHVPVLFMVSTKATANTTGLDLAWSEERMRSKWRSRDQGKAQISSLFNVVLAPGAPNAPVGFAITVPVFNEGIVPVDLETRKREIKGYLAGVYSIGEILAPELAELSSKGLHIKITDVDSASPVFVSHTDLNDGSLSTILYDKKVISIFGRKWQIVMFTTDDYFNKESSPYWLFTPHFLLVFCLILLFLIRKLYKNNQELAAVKTNLQQTLLEVSKSEQHFAELSRHDPLTGLLNRRSFYEKIADEISRSHRYNEDLCLLMVDIDNFKQINDRYGHPVGDSVLTQLASTFKELSRENDILCRIGGEEFALLLIKTNEEDSLIIAERLCDAVAKTAIELVTSDSPLHLTVSIGLTRCLQQDSTSSIMSRADKALYQAKNKGKNRVCVL